MSLNQLLYLISVFIIHIVSTQVYFFEIFVVTKTWQNYFKDLNLVEAEAEPHFPDRLVQGKANIQLLSAVFRHSEAADGQLSKSLCVLQVHSNGTHQFDVLEGIDGELSQRSHTLWGLWFNLTFYCNLDEELLDS